jgi:hypothetical protein
MAAPACAQAPLPTGPTREALPIPDKGGDAFHQEDLECRAMAAENLALGPAAGDALVTRLRERRVGVNLPYPPEPGWARRTPQQRYDVIYLGCHGTYGNGV